MLKKMALVLLFSMLIIAIFTGCTRDKEKEKSSELVKKTQGVAVIQGEAPIKITMTSGSIVIEAELDDSETSRQFIETLPVILVMKRSDDREYYARIPRISENGKAISNYENGDVTYYTGGPSFAVFFAKAGKSSQGGLIRMGKVTSDLSEFEQLGNEAKITIAVKDK
jgi:hypothetical protein